jgi:hypothetical protein
MAGRGARAAGRADAADHGMTDTPAHKRALEKRHFAVTRADVRSWRQSGNGRGLALRRFG